EAAGRLSFRQGQALRILRRPGDEGHRRQGQPGTAQRAAEAEARAVNETDRLRRFLFEDAPVRGHWVHLSRSWIEAREHQDLSTPARALLGESLAATVLLSAAVKFSGTLTLQLSGSGGPVSMLVTQATDTRTMRGVVHVDEDADLAGVSFPEMVQGGRLVVSVEQGEIGRASCRDRG